MSTLLIISEILGGFLFLFVFWRRLKEDYDSSLIFSTATVMILTIAIVDLAGKYLFGITNWWFWTSFLALLFGFVLGVLKFRLKFYELWDATCIASLFWLAPVFLVYSVAMSDLPALGAAVFLIVLTIGFYLLDSRYKSFSWYRSGKIGFLGLIIGGSFFLGRSVSSLLVSNVLSFVGKADSIVSGILAFGSFLLLYNLSVKKS